VECDFTGTLQVKTPDPALDRMVNDWLPYQALACRILARTAFYQASGAYGFRDQLQDTLAFILHRSGTRPRADPQRRRKRQFVEGDVQHWWLPDSGAGVRTDDLRRRGLARPMRSNIIAGHRRRHGARRKACLPRRPPLKAGGSTMPSSTGPLSAEMALSTTIARVRSIWRFQRTGENGLPLMLGGDWNDGMNRVGEAGRGTSVWLGWFLPARCAASSRSPATRGDGAVPISGKSHLGVA
jgi:cyclic beta-1,2-glucan synthetase